LLSLLPLLYVKTNLSKYQWKHFPEAAVNCYIDHFCASFPWKLLETNNDISTHTVLLTLTVRWCDTRFFAAVKIYIVTFGFMTSYNPINFTNVSEEPADRPLRWLSYVSPKSWYHWDYTASQKAAVPAPGTRTQDIMSWSHTVRSFASNCAKWRLYDMTCTSEET
jgi:hypothetical protein